MQNHVFELANVAGTFSVLHEGHKRYIDVAFSLAERVRIGVKNSEYAQVRKSYAVPPLDQRLAVLKKYLVEKQYTKRVEAFVIYKKPEDFRNELMNPLLDCAITSEEFIDLVEQINQQREMDGIPRFHIHIHPRFTQNGVDFSSAGFIAGNNAG